MRKRHPINEAMEVDRLISRTERDWYSGGRVPHFAEIEDAESLLDSFGLMNAGSIDTKRFSICSNFIGEGRGAWSHGAVHSFMVLEKDDEREKMNSLDRLSVDCGKEYRAKQRERKYAEQRAAYVAQEMRKKEIQDRRDVERAKREAGIRRLIAEEKARLMPNIKFVVEVSGGYFNLVDGAFPIHPAETWNGMTTKGVKVCARGDGKTAYGWAGGALSPAQYATVAAHRLRKCSYRNEHRKQVMAYIVINGRLERIHRNRWNGKTNAAQIAARCDVINEQKPAVELVIQPTKPTKPAEVIEGLPTGSYLWLDAEEESEQWHMR